MSKFLRTKRFWLAVAFLGLYTLFGFVFAPPIVARRLVDTIAKELGREALLRDVDLNPYTLSARIEGFRLLDPDREPFIAFEELFVDFQVSSLFRRAYTFKLVRLASLHSHVRLMPDEKPSYADILERLAAKPAPAKKRRGPPRILLQRLEVRDMRLKATNLAHPTPEQLEFTPVDLTLEKFTTVPKRDGTLSLAATGQGGGRWEWDGTVTFEPMHSSGTFAISGEKLPEVWQVVRERVAWEIPSGVLDLRFRYALDVVPDSMVAAVTEGSIALDRFAFKAKGSAPELLGVDSLRVSGVELRFPAQTATAERIALGGVRATAWLDPARRPNWLSLLTPPILTPSGVAKLGTTRPRAAGRTPWKVQAGEIALTGGAARFTDSTVVPPFEIALEAVDIILRNVSSAPGSKFDLESRGRIAGEGTFAFAGQAAAQPPEADVELQLDAFPLAILQPYVSAKAELDLVGGDAGATGRLVARVRDGVPDARFVGRLASRDFSSQDARTHERFLAWKQLDLGGVAAGTDSVRVASVRAQEPYGRIIVFQNRRTNIDEVLRVPPRDTTRVGATAKKPPVAVPTRIDVVRLEGGTADFADLSLVLPFAAGIVAMNGEVRGLSSAAMARADVALDGGLAPAGAVSVRGQINPLAGDLYTDLAVQFHGFDLPALSPYSGQFLGRKVDQGKLSLDLKYQVANRELVGENKVVLDQLELGEDVESPEATSLPVGLAVALLKDRNGRIDLDLPVKGNLDDPKFGIWDAVFDVLRNLVVKLVTAPFALLGRLVGWGGDGEEMSQVTFAPGEQALETAEQEKIAKLAAALAERPQLRLEVRGSTNRDADTQAIRAAKFAALADERSRREPAKYPPTLGGAGWSPRLFRDLYAEQLGAAALAELELRFQVPRIGKDGKPDPKKTVLDEPAFYAEARRALTEAQPVDPSELRALAQGRAMAVKNSVVASGVVPEMRVFLLEVDEDGPFAEGRVRMNLQLGS